MRLESLRSHRAAKQSNQMQPGQGCIKPLTPPRNFATVCKGLKAGHAVGDSWSLPHPPYNRQVPAQDRLHMLQHLQHRSAPGHLGPAPEHLQTYRKPKQKRAKPANPLQAAQAATLALHLDCKAKPNHLADVCVIGMDISVTLKV